MPAADAPFRPSRPPPEAAAAHVPSIPPAPRAPSIDTPASVREGKPPSPAAGPPRASVPPRPGAAPAGGLAPRAVPKVERAKQAAGKKGPDEEYSALATGDFALESDHGEEVEMLETGDFTIDDVSRPGVPRPGK